MFTKPNTCNTDCIYFDKCEKIEEHIKRKYDGSLGSKKLEKPKIVMMTNPIRKEKEYVEVMNNYKQNVIEIKNEYDIKEIAGKLEAWTLITADIAGSGKTYCLQNILD